MFPSVKWFSGQRQSRIAHRHVQQKEPCLTWGSLKGIFLVLKPLTCQGGWSGIVPASRGISLASRGAPWLEVVLPLPMLSTHWKTRAVKTLCIIPIQALRRPKSTSMEWVVLVRLSFDSYLQHLDNAFGTKCHRVRVKRVNQTWLVLTLEKWIYTIK